MCQLILTISEYLLQEGYEKDTCNQRLAAIKAYLWYVADENIDYQQTALAVSHVHWNAEGTDLSAMQMTV